jgi:biotin operon repressor
MNKIDKVILARLKAAKKFTTSSEIIEAINPSLTKGKVRCAIYRIRKSGVQIESSNQGYRYVSAKGPPKTKDTVEEAVNPDKYTMIISREDKVPSRSIFARLEDWVLVRLAAAKPHFALGKNALSWSLAILCMVFVWTYVSAEGYNVNRDSASGGWNFSPKASAPRIKAAPALPGTADAFNSSAPQKAFGSPAKEVKTALPMTTSGPQKAPEQPRHGHPPAFHAKAPLRDTSGPAEPVQVASLSSRVPTGISLNDIRKEIDRSLKAYQAQVKDNGDQQKEISSLKKKVYRLESEFRVLKHKVAYGSTNRIKKDSKSASKKKEQQTAAVKPDPGSVKFVNAVLAGNRSVARLLVVKDGKRSEQTVGIGDTVNGYIVRSISIDSVGVALPNGHETTIR